uniref:Uncharacterized protein n=1 Tax=Siphoviridae sp. ctqzz19 TaxID=2825682 RepID=A0A8S5U2B0_9CAUD|nr:MAG TPA: hypothetical protein [Siphoviridae sp. ctqzz19]
MEFYPAFFHKSSTVEWYLNGCVYILKRRFKKVLANNATLPVIIILLL